MIALNQHDEQVESRYVQIERLCFTLELVARFHFGITTDRIHDEVSERFGIVARTTSRDIACLKRIGWIRCESFRYAPDVFKLNTECQLAKVFQFPQTRS